MFKIGEYVKVRHAIEWNKGLKRKSSDNAFTILEMNETTIFKIYKLDGLDFVNLKTLEGHKIVWGESKEEVRWYLRDIMYPSPLELAKLNYGLKMNAKLKLAMDFEEGDYVVRISDETFFKTVKFRTKLGGVYRVRSIKVEDYGFETALFLELEGHNGNFEENVYFRKATTLEIARYRVKDV